MEVAFTSVQSHVSVFEMESINAAKVPSHSWLQESSQMSAMTISPGQYTRSATTVLMKLAEKIRDWKGVEVEGVRNCSLMKGQSTRVNSYAVKHKHESSLFYGRDRRILVHVSMNVDLLLLPSSTVRF